MNLRRSLLAALTAIILSIVPLSAPAQIYIGIPAPPLLPVYTQPYLTQPNYIWQPGYWAWGPFGYYWVPGTWVAAPSTGLFWTPGYWSWLTNGYRWNSGYWAPAVGYYGGVNYGYGYYGNGYVGGMWYGNVFRYNTAVTRVNTTIVKNVYVNKTVVVTHVVRTSYNGGPRGLTVRPTHQQIALASQHRVGMTTVQREHVAEAQKNRYYLTTVNHGNPAHPAVAHPLNAVHQPPGFKPVTNADRESAPHPKPPPQNQPKPAKPPA